LLDGPFYFFRFFRVIPEFRIFADPVFFFQFDELAIYVKETPSTPPGVLKVLLNDLL
jgi:hypothetical protein